MKSVSHGRPEEIEDAASAPNPDGTSATVANGIGRLIGDHRELDKLFDELDNASGAGATKDLIIRVSRAISAHEDVEASVLGPVIRSRLDGGRRLSRLQRKRYHETERLLAILAPWMPATPPRVSSGAARDIVTNLPGPPLESRCRPSHTVEMQDKSHPMVQVAGILLTGGRSRRMGFDKASISINGVPSAKRTAQVLCTVVSPVIEVGPGRSGLAAVCEEPPGSGPLVAIGVGAEALRRAGHDGPALVLACDLPRVTNAALGCSWTGPATVPRYRLWTDTPSRCAPDGRPRTRRRLPGSSTPGSAR